MKTSGRGHGNGGGPDRRDAANEHTPDDSRKHIEICFDIAQQFDADVDMHVDETDDPFYRTLEMLATKPWNGDGREGDRRAIPVPLPPTMTIMPAMSSTR